MAPLIGASPTHANEVMLLTGLVGGTCSRRQCSRLGATAAQRVIVGFPKCTIVFQPLGWLSLLWEYANVCLYTRLRDFFFSLYQFPNSQLRY